jgi:hypothetical protein
MTVYNILQQKTNVDSHEISLQKMLDLSHAVHN